MNSYTLFGYIDPGAGFILLQIIVAGAIGTVVYFRRLLWGFASMISGRANQRQETPDDLDAQNVSQKTDLASEHSE